MACIHTHVCMSINSLISFEGYPMKSQNNAFILNRLQIKISCYFLNTFHCSDIIWVLLYGKEFLCRLFCWIYFSQDLLLSCLLNLIWLLLFIIDLLVYKFYFNSSHSVRGCFIDCFLILFQAIVLCQKKTKNILIYVIGREKIKVIMIKFWPQNPLI